MKKSLFKIVSVLLVVMLAFASMVCLAAAETTVVVDDSSLNNTDTAGDSINSFKGARDIYLVLDISGSMSGTPIKYLKDAAKQFCATMLGDKNAENRIAIVTYGTSVESYSFSTDYAELANIIDGLKAKGSTAMYDALMAVKEINEKYGNSAASKHVVVMADGLPNVGAVLSNGKYTSKDSSMYFRYGNAVYSTAAGMWPDYMIYSIGFFHSLGGSQLKYGQTLMKDIQNALYLEVFDPDKIQDAFDGIADDITNDKNKEDNDNSSNVNGETSTEKPSETTTKAPETTTKAPNSDKKIPQTSGTVMGVSAAVIVMVAGMAVVATKKRED